MFLPFIRNREPLHRYANLFWENRLHACTTVPIILAGLYQLKAQRYSGSGLTFFKKWTVLVITTVSLNMAVQWLPNWVQNALMIGGFCLYLLRHELFGTSTPVSVSIAEKLRKYGDYYSESDLRNVPGLEDLSNDKIRGQITELMETYMDLQSSTKLPSEQVKANGLFYGPPGTGKTVYAKAIAKELKAKAFVHVRSGSLITKWQGSGAEALEDIFGLAKELGKTHECIVIFFDEFEGLGAQRNKDVFREDTHRAVTTLLALLDGLLSNILVLAATNIVTICDQAVVRADRFNFRIPFELPMPEEKLQFFIQKMAKYRIPCDLGELKSVLLDIGEASYADLSVLFNRAISLGERGGASGSGSGSDPSQNVLPRLISLIEAFKAQKKQPTAPHHIETTSKAMSLLHLMQTIVDNQNIIKEQQHVLLTLLQRQLNPTGAEAK